MTEKEWPSEELQAMLQSLRGEARDRKLRLFASCYARQVWQALPEAARQVVAAIEELVEDPASGAPLEASKQAAWDAWLKTASFSDQEDAAWLVVWAASVNPGAASSLTALVSIENAARVLAGQTEQLETVRERRQQLAVFARDVLGNPSRHVTTDHAWLTWRDATIPKLAQAAYDERELPGGCLNADRLRVLADALEEAGCTSEVILRHLRGPGPHVRGCWVVDLLLGKE